MNFPVRALVHGTFSVKLYLFFLYFFQDKTSFEQTKPEWGAQFNSSSIVQILT